MEQFKHAHEVAQNIINNTDIKYLAHYWFANLEWQVYEEIRDNVTDELTPYEIEKILDEVYKYVLGELNREIFMFTRYSLPEYKPLLYNYLISKDATTKV